MQLNVEDVKVCFDTAQILNGVCLQMEQGEVVSLVGPNGAGKSTLLRTIAGLLKWQRDTLKGTKAGRITIEGCVTYDGERIDNLPAHEIVRRGLVLCPERGRPFREMTIVDNLIVAAFLIKDTKIIKENLEKVYHLFPVLKDRESQIAGTISGGERTMLAIGRALMAQPGLLLIDEPSTGLAPKLKEELFDSLEQIHGMGLSILIVEQDINYAFEMAKRNYVISKGCIVAEGTKEELLSDSFFGKTYLGIV